MENEKIDLNKFIGKEHERAKFFAKLVECKRVNTHYGERHIYKFQTRSGKFGAFFSDLLDELNHEHIGQCFHFTGTVKTHQYNEYSKHNETMFNRVKVEKVFEKVEEELDI